MFRIQVYDKRSHPLEPLFWIFSIGSLVLIGTSFLLDSPHLPRRDLSYILLPSVIIVGILRMILLWHQHGPVGKISYLTVDEDSIHFLDKKVSISGIVKIMIKLDDDRVQYSRSRNNLFEIKTTYGQTYKFGILIYDSGDEKQVVGIVELLKSKINDFTYDGYM
jgi:hypothetical protein